ncbi:MAG TPA: DUF459 domain-containing protein [Acidimicrobiales bacterium]|nr:DUF459 domain-containing protein [Acidimicrobiales bacterium]
MFESLAGSDRRTLRRMPGIDVLRVLRWRPLLPGIGVALLLFGLGVPPAVAGRAENVAARTTAALPVHGKIVQLAPHRRRHRSVHRTATLSGGLPAIVQPIASHHLVLLKIGDSLGEELGFGLRDMLGTNKHVTVLQNAVGDTGLARPDYYNWPLHLSQQLAQYHPQGVIVMLGGDDGQGFVDQGRTVEFGTALWRSIYAERVATMMAEATEAGAHVIWVGLPIMGSGYFSAEMAQMNAIYAAEAATHAGVTFVSTWMLFANPAGQYAAFLPGPGGTSELMRNPDGVHFSGAGADRLASAVVGAMERAWTIRL